MFFFLCEETEVNSEQCYALKIVIYIRGFSLDLKNKVQK
jgi:hypothetical protein